MAHLGLLIDRAEQNPPELEVIILGPIMYFFQNVVSTKKYISLLGPQVLKSQDVIAERYLFQLDPVRK